MDLEMTKQLRNEYPEPQIALMEQFEELKERIYGKKAVSEPPQEKPQPSNSFDYAQMTRQQRRAYERRLAKEKKRKH